MNWLEHCRSLKKKFPLNEGSLKNDHLEDGEANIYTFMKALNNYCSSESAVVCDAGSAIYVPSQSFTSNQGARFVLDGGQAGMGAAIPMSIGVSLAKDKGEVFVVTGDGSFQTNIQELAVIRYHNLPIKIFVWNNSGYLSIKNTQKAFYDGRIYGTDKESGLFFPEFEDIAKAYGFEYDYFDDTFLETGFMNLMGDDRPWIIEVKCSPNQKIMPNIALKDGKSCNLDDMAPFLSDEYLAEQRNKFKN